MKIIVNAVFRVFSIINENFQNSDINFSIFSQFTNNFIGKKKCYSNEKIMMIPVLPFVPKLAFKWCERHPNLHNLYLKAAIYLLQLI